MTKVATMHFSRRRTVSLTAGDLHCEREPVLLRTVLGSCVAVCLWDRRQRFGGMSHFLLPNCPDPGDWSPRFGDVAVATLVGRMQALGSSASDLLAKLFGGANVLPTDMGAFAVGGRNIDIARAELARHGIPVVASHLSGEQGVVLVQCTDCGDVWLRRLGAVPPKPAAPPARPARRDLETSALRSNLRLAAENTDCGTCGMPARGPRAGVG